MTLYFSKSTKGFYNSDIHTTLPTDAVEITVDEYQILLDGQSQGLQISFPSSGKPSLVESSSLLSLIETKEKRKAFINSERNRVINEGMEFEGNVFDIDDVSLSRISSVITAVNVSVPLPEGFTWRSKDNQNVPMDSTKLITFGATALGYFSSIMQKSWALKDLIDTKNTKAKVVQVTWETTL